jgi:hypothetical protein
MSRISPIKTSFIALSITALFFAVPRTTPAAVDPQFPFTVPVDQGGVCFQDGDEILLTEVHGTADDFKPGNDYKITGQYRLLSHSDATLSVGVIAPNGNSPAASGRQLINIKKGIGNFTLILPYANPGRARISLDADGQTVGNLTLIPGNFPYVVSFKQTHYDLPDGDDITITEVRNASSAISTGNVLQVHGTYVLANGTARLSTSQSNPSNDATDQVVEVNKGAGDFTLLVPVTDRNAVGVGLWNIGSAASPAGSVGFHLGKTEAAPATRPSVATIPIMASDESPVLFNYSLERGANGQFYATENSYIPGSFPFLVHFKSGLTQYTGGDSINVTRVRGTFKYIKLGSYYQISGVYTLASFPSATLAAYVTTPNWVRIPTMPQQYIRVTRGTGNFTLILPITNLGWPHLAFYPDDWITDSDTHYFGTGDSVLHSWWDKPPVDEATGSGAAD